LNDLDQLWRDIVQFNAKTPRTNDSVYGIKDFLVYDEEFVQVEQNKELPERITFIAHGSPFKFGPYKPEELADYIVAQVTQAAKIKPALKLRLKKMDFIGCNVGAIREGNTDFYLFKVAKIIEEKLNKKGFNIEVMGFTTQNLNEKGEKCFSSVFNLNDDPINPQCAYYAYPTKEHEQKNNFLKDQNTKLIEQMSGLKHELFKINKQIKENPIEKKSNEFNMQIANLKEQAKANQEARDDLKKQAEGFITRAGKLEAPTDGQKQTIKEHKQTLSEKYDALLETKAEISDEYKKIMASKNTWEQGIVAETKAKFEGLIEKRDDLKANLNGKRAAFDKNEELMKGNRRQLYTTTDVRRTLDEDPNCSCTNLVRKSKMPPEQRYSTIVKIENASADEQSAQSTSGYGIKS